MRSRAGAAELRIALLLLVACGSRAVPPPPPPLRPDPEPRPSLPVEAPPVPPPPQPPPPPDLRVLHSFPGLDLLESSNTGAHQARGPAAKIEAVRIELAVTDRRAHELEARKVTLLHRRCAQDTWTWKKPLRIVGHSALWGDPGETQRGEVTGKASVVLPAGEPRRITLYVRIETIRLLQECEVFAFALDVVFDRVRHVFELPLQITRVEAID